MDFKRPPEHAFTRASPSYKVNDRPRSLSELNWDIYRKKLSDRNIKQNTQRWYVLRVEALLKTNQDKSLAEITAEDVRRFLQSFLQNSSFEDWQILQAIDAIQILCTEVLDRKSFSSLNWDDFRLGVKTIDTSHATLAREAVSGSDGKPTYYVMAHKGDLAEVFIQYRNEMEAFLVELRSRHYSIRTEQSYEQWILRLLARHRDKSAQELTGENIKAFVNDIVVRGNVSASTRNQALSALLFFYRHVLNKNTDDLGDIALAKRPKRLPVVLTKEEVHRVLGQLDGTTWLVAALLYGAGLRLMECVRLRVMDVDFGYSQITVRHGKGGKDRIVPLPERCFEPLRKQLDEVKTLHEKDTGQGFGEVCLMRSPGSIPPQHVSGAGNISFWPRVYRSIPVVARPADIICMRLAYRK